MRADLPELSSLATSLGEVADRLARLAGEVSERGEEGAAFDLFEVERSLRTAQRRLDRLIEGR